MSLARSGSELQLANVTAVEDVNNEIEKARWNPTSLADKRNGEQ